MKEELLKNLVSIVDYVKQGADFAVSQAPLFVQEYLKYHFALHLFWGVICFIILILSIWLFILAVKYIKKEHDDLGILVFPLGFMIFPLVGFIVNITTILKIYFAPRVYLVESLLEIFNK